MEKLRQLIGANDLEGAFKYLENCIPSKSSSQDLDQLLSNIATEKGLFAEFLDDDFNGIVKAEDRMVRKRQFALRLQAIGKRVFAIVKIGHLPTDKPATKILMLAANPIMAKGLRLNTEANAIDKALRLSYQRSGWKFEQEHEVKRDEILGKIVEHRPQILHFSGHGDYEGIVVLDEHELAIRLHNEDLVSMMQLVLRRKIDLKLLLLNCCKSAELAKATSTVVPYAIGTTGLVLDRSSTVFASSFYQSLFIEDNIPIAFDFACLQLKVAGSPDWEKFKLFTKAK